MKFTKAKTKTKARIVYEEMRESQPAGFISPMDEVQQGVGRLPNLKCILKFPMNTARA